MDEGSEIMCERIVKNNPAESCFTPWCQRKTFGQEKREVNR
jgi:hypothetical protein